MLEAENKIDHSSEYADDKEKITDKLTQTISENNLFEFSINTVNKGDFVLFNFKENFIWLSVWTSNGIMLDCEIPDIVQLNLENKDFVKDFAEMNPFGITLNKEKLGKIVMQVKKEDLDKASDCFTAIQSDKLEDWLEKERPSSQLSEQSKKTNKPE
jgi:hypothetical protein